MIGQALAGSRVAVSLGAGGVGKTTVSAAIALARARAGERVAVVTIDPARRLAGALGLDGLDDEPRRVAEVGPGQLWALQLDAAATFDRLIARHAIDAAQRERILGNRIYRHMSRSVAGSQEFMAVERLHELHEDPRFDLVVLDTPPAQNSVDFLDAPARITRAMEARALKILTAGGGGGGNPLRQIVDVGSSAILGVVERLTGAGLLGELREFVGAFDGMREGFSARARLVGDLLRSELTAYCLISAPARVPLADARALRARLVADEIQPRLVVLNRFPPHAGADSADESELARRLRDANAVDADDLARRAMANDAAMRDARRRAEDHAAVVEAEFPSTPVARVAALDPEPVDLAGLDRIVAALEGAADTAG